MVNIQNFSKIQYSNSKDSVQTKNNDVIVAKEVKISSDQLNISVKQGIVPTLKGAGAGALFAGAASVGLFALVTKGQIGGRLTLLTVPLAISTTLGGAVGGGVAANTTSDKLKGALNGAAGGAITGGASMAILTVNWYAIAAGVGVGAISGAAGGFAGSMVAKEK